MVILAEVSRLEEQVGASSYRRAGHPGSGAGEQSGKDHGAQGPAGQGVNPEFAIHKPGDFSRSLCP